MSETLRRCKNLIPAERNSSDPLVVSSVTMNKYEIVHRPAGTNALARPQMNKADCVGLQSNENGSVMTRTNKAESVGIQMHKSEFVGRPSNVIPQMNKAELVGA